MSIWISVDFMRPNDNQSVLAFVDGVFIVLSQYRDGDFIDVIKDENGCFFETVSRDVTHWMPLPEPPEDI